jgi:hypothetical protein
MRELEGLRMKPAAGNGVDVLRAGPHEDLVLAVALASWVGPFWPVPGRLRCIPAWFGRIPGTIATAADPCSPAGTDAPRIGTRRCRQRQPQTGSGNARCFW